MDNLFPQMASQNYSQSSLPAYLSVPTNSNLVPVIDNILSACTNAAGAGTPLTITIEGVVVARHNMTGNADFTFQDEFNGGYPIHTNGIPPDLTPIEQYTTADNIFYLIQGGISGGNEKASQSWTTANTYRVRYIDLNIDKVGSPTDTIFIDVRTGSPTGSLVAQSGLIYGANVSTTKGYVRFTFNESTVFQTSFGSKYYITLWRNGSRDTNNYYRWYGTNTSGQANGGAYQWSANAPGAENGTDDLNWKAQTGYRVLFGTSNSSNNVMTILYHYVRGEQLS
jgi:hypothetical protein